MGRALSLLLALLLSSSYSITQISVTSTAWEYVTEERGVTIEKRDVSSEYAAYDFGRLCLEHQSGRLGYIGSDYQRFYIHFTSITKDSSDPHLYHVRGKTRVRNNLCDFVGTLLLKSIRRLFDPDACENDVRPTVQGIACFTYEFREDPNQGHVGQFEGTAAIQWYLDSNKRLCYDKTWNCSDRFTNNCFVGEWTSYSTHVSKPCNWGDCRIPFSGDLDIGAGEFSPGPKYRRSGWEQFPSDAQNEWWK